MSFEIDLVPSLKLELDALTENSTLKSHVTSLCQEYGVSTDTRNFMAISLHRADKQMFEIDFHDVERKILYNRGCTKKVIKLIKYLRDSKGKTVEKLWSHLLKVIRIMHLLQKQNYKETISDFCDASCHQDSQGLLEQCQLGEVLCGLHQKSSRRTQRRLNHRHIFSNREST